MPAAARRRGAAAEAPAAEAGPQLGGAQEQPHTDRTKHILNGHLTDDPRRRQAGQDREVTEMHVASDGREGPATWSVTVWGARGEEAWAKLEKGDNVKVMGTWDPDYQRGDGGPTRTHQMTASVSIGVEVPGKDEPVPLGSFDRSMLTALENPALEGLGSVADAGGMSAAD